MDSRLIDELRQTVENYDGRPLRIMEVCGTHTHEIFRLGIRRILPERIRLISGPGCPVCVTPVGFIDQAMWLATEKKAIICTFGDLIRVPGSRGSLAKARADGAEIRMVYSPMDAVEIARSNPDREVVFLSVGFETTVPVECLAIRRAESEGIANFSLLVANKTMPAAYEALKGCADAFLYPGHVCAVSGTGDCEAMVEKGVSGVVAGFTPAELLGAIVTIIRHADDGKPFFVNCYPRVVKEKGNPAAMKIVSEYMQACDTEWRGLGVIPRSGLRIRDAYAHRDAARRFAIPPLESRVNRACRCGEVLQGKCLPTDCPLFGKGCNPMRPVGACMVSNEGTCSAYYQFGEKK